MTNLHESVRSVLEQFDGQHITLEVTQNEIHKLYIDKIRQLIEDKLPGFVLEQVERLG